MPSRKTASTPTTTSHEPRNRAERRHPEPRFASFVEAGAFTGTSKDSIRRMVDRGELKTYRIGRLVRVDLNELIAAMAANAGR